MLDELVQYLNSKGWNYKELRERSGLQFRLMSECPFCNHSKHLYFNAEDGRWDCKRCGEKGNLLTMKRRLNDLDVNISSPSDMFINGPRKSEKLEGERPPRGTDVSFHNTLKSEKGAKALVYLKEVRGFSTETIDKFKLGCAVKAGKEMLSIPHYAGGELVNMKFRTLPPAKKTFSRWKGCPSVLFNGDSIAELSKLPPRERYVFMFEGESDAMAFHEYGYKNVVASTAGASSWPEHWLKPLESATTIFLVYDNDEAGNAGALKAASILGKYRCKRVRLPLHDAGDCLAAGIPKQDVDQAIRDAVDLGDNSIKPTSAYADELKARLFKPQPKGNSTGWLALDSIIGGVRDGEVTVVTGDTGSGKSTWVTNWARNQALQGKPLLVAPFEQQPWEVVGKLTSMHGGESVYDMSATRVDDELKKVCNLPIYFLEKHGPTPLNDIRDAVYLGVSRFGVQRVVIDHMHYSMECVTKNERQKITEYVQAVELWAKDLDIHILLVVHPTKLGQDPRNGNTRKVQLDDLKGASAIKQTCDNAIRVHRHREDSYGGTDDLTEITVLKCRSPAGSEGAAWFYFDSYCERFVDGAYPPGKERRTSKASSQASSTEPDVESPDSSPVVVNHPEHPESWDTWDTPQ